MTDNHAVSIIEGKLDVSYEAADRWEAVGGSESEEFPATAVLLLTRCCENNHEHIELTHKQASVLADWLDAFVAGNYYE